MSARVTSERNPIPDYPIELRRLGDEGWEACIPALGRWSCVALGDTPQEALKELEHVRDTVVELLLEQGARLPDVPREAEPDDYSGRFLVRLPKQLHKDLSTAAEANGTSLNQYITYLLSTRLERDVYQQAIERTLQIPGALWQKAAILTEMRRWSHELPREHKAVVRATQETNMVVSVGGKFMLYEAKGQLPLKASSTKSPAKLRRVEVAA